MKDIYEKSKDGTIYVCGACGKTSRTLAPTEFSDAGWDESCMLNSALCFDDDETPYWRAVEEVKPKIKLAHSVTLRSILD